MEQRGIIVSIDEGHAVIRVCRDNACGKCKAMCHIGSEQQEMLLNLPSDFEAVPGDAVILSIMPSKLIKAAFIAYFIPLSGLVLGVVSGLYIAGNFGLNQEAMGLVGGLFFTTFAFLGIWAVEPCIAKKNDFIPKVVSIQKQDSKGEFRYGD